MDRKVTIPQRTLTPVEDRLRRLAEMYATGGCSPYLERKLLGKLPVVVVGGSPR